MIEHHNQLFEVEIFVLSLFWVAVWNYGWCDSKKRVKTIRATRCLLGYWPSSSVRSREAEYWPSSIFACLWIETESRSINSQKTKEANIQPPWPSKLAWSIKDLLYGVWGNFSCGTRRVALSRQDNSILPARVANHSAGFDSSCQLTS